jgi:hypothetical protein
MRKIMKIIRFSVFTIILGFLFLGCAKISPSDAAKMSSKELCEVMMGAAVPPKDRRTVNAEVRDRGISCRDEATQSRFNQQGGVYRRRPSDY